MILIKNEEKRTTHAQNANKTHTHTLENQTHTTHSNMYKTIHT